MEQVIHQIQSYIAGDRDAFDVIHNFYKNRLWAFLCARADNRDDAEELFAQTAMTVAGKLATLQDPKKLVSWVLGIANFKIREFYKRKRGVEVDVEEVVNQLVDGQRNPEDSMVLDQSVVRLHKCLRQLPEHQRSYLTLQYFGEVAQKDVAEHFSIKASALKSQVFRAKLKMLNCLKKHGALAASERDQTITAAVRGPRPLEA